MPLTKADLKKAKLVAKVDLSKWLEKGSTGYVCAMSAANALRLSDGDDAKGNESVYDWVLLCFCDEQGKLMFDDEAEARTAFGEMPFKMLEHICEAAMKVNGMSEDGQQDTAKN